MIVASLYRWTGDHLEPLEYCDRAATVIEAADSWLVSDGRTLGLDLHRQRFLAAVPEAGTFWDAAIALIPREGDWFPRVEARLVEARLVEAPRVETRRRDSMTRDPVPEAPAGASALVFRLRSAPERTRSVVLATWTGADPRTSPRVKGPDLASMLRIRTSVQAAGAGEAVILSPEGYLVEGAYSGLLWWRGDILCGPPADLDRVDSVTARSVLTLAAALGFDTHEEAVTPAELAETELWALNALHGIRIVTRWVNGPQLAERPGRLGAWRARLDALRRPI